MLQVELDPSSLEQGGETSRGSHPNSDEDPQFLIQQKPEEGGDEELH